MYHVSLVFQYIYECSDEGSENGNGNEGREWRLSGLLYADDLVLCSKSEGDLRVTMVLMERRDWSVR